MRTSEDGTMPRAVLFDAVGTLIFPDPPVAEAYHRLGRELGSSRTLAEIKELFRDAYRRSESLFALPGNDAGLARQPTSDDRERQRWRQVVGEVFGDLPADLADAALEGLWRHFAQPAHWRLYDDVAAVWRNLTRRGFVLGIASNFDSRLETICRGLPPLDQCRHVFISSQIGYPKPAPQFFRTVEEQLGLRGEEILLVGDDWTN
ncbi:MAG TPA: HAD family hydrolase, partial [Pirellulaceae bacterium]|nr:HAD family hydrolase [Pirellulaceae bacterium]